MVHMWKCPIVSVDVMRVTCKSQYTSMYAPVPKCTLYKPEQKMQRNECIEARTTLKHICVHFISFCFTFNNFTICELLLLLARVFIFTTLRFYQLFVAVIEQLLFSVFYILQTPQSWAYIDSERNTRERETKWEKATLREHIYIFYIFRFSLPFLLFFLFILPIFWKK